MSLDERQAFKAGFLAHCVELGMGPGEIRATVKAAADKLAWGLPGEDLVGKGVDLIKSWGAPLAHAVLPTALLAPPLIGAGLGYGAAALTDTSGQDVEDVKNRELIDEYRRQSERLRSMAAPQHTGRPRSHHSF